MRGFILVSFAFLAWCFWELSGGADYERSVAATPIFAPTIPLEERRETAEAERSFARETDTVLTSADLAETPRAAPRPDPEEGVIDLRTQTDRLVLAALATDASLDIDPALDGELATALDTPLEPGETRLTALLEPGPLDGISTEGLSVTSFDGPVRLGSATTGALTGQSIALSGFGATGSAAAPGPSTPDLREIDGSNVNMRAGPGTGFSVLGKLSSGDRVEVIEVPGDGWLKLRVVGTGQVGYIADWLVSARIN